jgi:hypothetical protein
VEVGCFLTMLPSSTLHFRRQVAADENIECAASGNPNPEKSDTEPSPISSSMNCASLQSR